MTATDDAGCQTAQDRLGGGRLVVLVQALHSFVNPVVPQQPRSLLAFLIDNQINFLQNTKSTKGDVFPVTDWSRDQKKCPGHRKSLARAGVVLS